MKIEIEMCIGCPFHNHESDDSRMCNQTGHQLNHRAIAGFPIGCPLLESNIVVSRKRNEYKLRENNV